MRNNQYGRFKSKVITWVNSDDYAYCIVFLAFVKVFVFCFTDGGHMYDIVRHLTFPVVVLGLIMMMGGHMDLEGRFKIVILLFINAFASITCLLYLIFKLMVI